MIVNNKFLNEPDSVKNHIIVHSLLKYIYLNVLKDESRLEKNILRSKNHKTNEYARAWKIVEQEGYKNLIEEFKNKLVPHTNEAMGH